jgi:hypothetical protein
MMSTYLREKVVRGEETVEVLIEVDKSIQGPWEEYAYDNQRGEEDSGLVTTAFTKGMDLIQTCAEKVAETVQKVSDATRPDEVEVKFGVKLSGETGALALIAKAGTEAHMEVTLKWTGKTPA